MKTIGEKKIRKLSAYKGTMTNSRITMVLVLLFFSFLLFIIFLFGLKQKTFEGGFSSNLLIFIPVASVFIAISALTIYLRELSQELHRMREFTGGSVNVKGYMYKRFAFGSAIIFATLFAIIAFLSYIDFLEVLSTLDFIILTIVGFCAPIGLYDILYERRRQIKFDRKLPEFLRDMAESASAGMPIHRAIKYSARGDYGILTDDIKVMASQLEWGMSLKQTLPLFAKRVNTPLTYRAISLIIEASIAGGNVTDVLYMAASDLQELKHIEDEQRKSLDTYVAILYVAFFVFLIVVVILLRTLGPVFLEMSENKEKEEENDLDTEQSDPKFAAGGMSDEHIQTLQQYSYFALIIQGVGDGIIIGVMKEKSFRAGLIHVSLFLILSLVFYNLVVI